WPMPATTWPTCCAWPTPSRSGWRPPVGSRGPGGGAAPRRGPARGAPRGAPLREGLEATGRLQWAREECRRLEEASDERDPELAWQRLPRIAQLNPRARAVARELAAWRERTAAAEDRPMSSVLGDAPLVEVAKRRPTSLSALERIRGLQPWTLRRRGDAILAAVARGE